MCSAALIFVMREGIRFSNKNLDVYLSGAAFCVATLTRLMRTQMHSKHLIIEFCMIYDTIRNVPAPISRRPAGDFAVNFLCRMTKAGRKQRAQREGFGIGRSMGAIDTSTSGCPGSLCAGPRSLLSFSAEKRFVNPPGCHHLIFFETP